MLLQSWSAWVVGGAGMLGVVVTGLLALGVQRYLNH